MFSVVTDTSHTAGLTMHATILAYVFALVESGKVNISSVLENIRIFCQTCQISENQGQWLKFSSPAYFSNRAIAGEKQEPYP